MEICVPFTDFSSLSPVPYLLRSFKRPGLPQLPRMELVTIRTTDTPGLKPFTMLQIITVNSFTNASITKNNSYTLCVPMFGLW